MRDLPFALDDAGIVSKRFAVHTADMRDLPFADETFAVVVSNLAIHNIPYPRRGQVDPDRRRGDARAVVGCSSPTSGRRTSIGRRSSTWGMADVALRRLGWRFLYGEPWLTARPVSATTPA